MGKSFLQWLFMSDDNEPAPDTIRVTYNKQRYERNKIKKRRRENKQRRITRRK